jgi:hypothetical protein
LASGDVTQARWAALLKRMMATKGPDPGRFITPTINGTFELTDKYKPEDRVSRGERMFGGGGQEVNAVANPQQGIIQNPPNSGRITIVKRVTWALNMPTATIQPGIAYLGIVAPQAITTVTGSPLSRFFDGRAGFGNVPGAVATSVLAGQNTIYNSFSNFALASCYVQAIFPAAATTPFLFALDEANVVLPPGSVAGVSLGSDTAATGTYSWFWWAECYERVVDPSELIPPP